MKRALAGAASFCVCESRQGGGVSSWFAKVDLTRSSAAGRRVFDQVSDLLDHLQPAWLDPSDQTVAFEEGETWIKLRHDSEPLLKIEFVLNDGWVNFYGVMGHDEAYSTRAEPPDSSETETVEILSDLLLSDYTIDTYGRRGKRWREVVGIGPPYNLTISRSLFPLRLPGQKVRLETQHASFECRGARPASTP